MLTLSIDPAARALIFDIDGTLVDTLAIHYRAWKATLLELDNYSLSSQQFKAIIGYGKNDMVERLSLLLARPLDFRLHVERQEAHYASDLVFARPIEPVVTLLTDYFGRLPVCLATSEHRRIAELNIKAAGLVGRFDFLLAAEDVDRPKPDPEIYLEASRLMGRAPEFCQVFEDSPVGIRAARSAGMMVTDVSACTSDVLF